MSGTALPGHMLDCRLLLPAAMLWLLSLCSRPALAAEPVGEVVYARGAVSAQLAGQPPQLIAGGSPLPAGAVITTGPGSFALLEFSDKTRIVLRPDTAFAVEAFTPAAGGENAVLRLFKGGLRAVTGLISKTRADAFSVKTATATIGIRGTDFTARLCGPDCVAESKQQNRKEQAPSPVVARVVLLVGDLSRLTAEGGPHPLWLGAPVYAGDVLESAANAYAALAFRDESRIVLTANTRFKIDKFSYDAAKPDGDSALFQLVKGGMRALTGLIAKRNVGQFHVQTAVATIGIRGTGFDLVYPQACAEGSTAQGLVGHVWKGRIAFEESRHDIGEGETACVDSRGGQARELRQAPAMNAPRPDEIKVPANTFGAQELAGGESGLHVSVFEGHVVLTNGEGDLHLGVGENGYAQPGVAPVRYVSDRPIGRIDPYFGFDPTAGAQDWAGFDPTVGGGQCPVGP